jgi:drug/metabolite transporter (DMT)-like permease
LSSSPSETPQTKLEPIGWPAAAVALAVCLARGANQVSLKFGLTAFSPWATAFWRMLVGLLVVGAWARARGIPLTPSHSEWRPLVQLGLLFIVQISFLHAGADLTSPAYAVVLMNSNPVFANLIAHFVVPEDRLSASRLLGLGIAFGGVAAVFWGRSYMALAPNPGLGNALILASALGVGWRTVYTQRLVQRIEPTKTAFWQMALSTPCFGLAELLVTQTPRGPVTWASVWGLLYQGIVVSGVAFVAWIILLRRHSPGRLTVFSFTVPLFGVVLSHLLFGEAVTPRLVLGVVAVVLGIALAARSGAQPPATAGQEGEG